VPWLQQTTDHVALPQAGILSKAWWRRANFVPDSEPFVEILVPSDVAGVDEIATDFETDGVRYVTGGWTQNVLFTRNLDMWSQGIEAPVQIPSVVASGTGITASVICYWAYVDDKTGERSPLSTGSATLVLANQGVAWSDFPVPINPRVTHIELWRSVDGSLPRLVLRRQVGITGTLVESVDAGDLGEAFTEDFSKFPRCRVNAFYHDRQYMAGYERDRTVLYCSLIDFPERMSTIDLRTKNGEPIIGLHVVNDYLLVFCPFATYAVTGFTEDDIAITVAKPDIGIISPNAKCAVKGGLYFWADAGLWSTDGASFQFLGNDVQPRFVQEYRVGEQQLQGHTLPDPSYLRNYEASWAVNNINGYCAQLWVNRHTDFLTNPFVGGLTEPLEVFWVANYESSNSTAEGNYSNPAWSYDTGQIPHTCGAVLTIPGSRQQELVFGATQDILPNIDSLSGAFLHRQNTGGHTDHEDVGLVIVNGAEFFDDVGGDLAHGKTFKDLEIYAVILNDNGAGTGENTGYHAEVWCGGSYAGFQGVINGLITASFAPNWEWDVTTFPVVSSPDDDGFITVQQPQNEWHFPLSYCSGDAVSLQLRFFDRGTFYLGYGISFKSGPKFRHGVRVKPID
jgi:hypothetical protein